jgi:hypothetical protein
MIVLGALYACRRAGRDNPNNASMATVRVVNHHNASRKAQAEQNKARLNVRMLGIVNQPRGLVIKHGPRLRKRYVVLPSVRCGLG